MATVETDAALNALATCLGSEGLILDTIFIKELAVNSLLPGKFVVLLHDGEIPGPHKLFNLPLIVTFMSETAEAIAAFRLHVAETLVAAVQDGTLNATVFLKDGKECVRITNHSNKRASRESEKSALAEKADAGGSPLKKKQRVAEETVADANVVSAIVFAMWARR
jgi:hypothetical protein